jgi:hypothetical protein
MYSEMDRVEPLKGILEMYPDKNSVFSYYLPDAVLNKIGGAIYHEDTNDQLFIHDKLYCVDRSTLKLTYTGPIVHYMSDDITIRIKNKYYVRIEPTDYYIFYTRKLKTSKKDYMISLLKLL